MVMTQLNGINLEVPHRDAEGTRWTRVAVGIPGRALTPRCSIHGRHAAVLVPDPPIRVMLHWCSLASSVVLPDLPSRHRCLRVEACTPPLPIKWAALAPCACLPVSSARTSRVEKDNAALAIHRSLLNRPFSCPGRGCARSNRSCGCRRRVPPWAVAFVAPPLVPNRPGVSPWAFPTVPRPKSGEGSPEFLAGPPLAAPGTTLRATLSFQGPECKARAYL
jgi:hypothetical protein